MVRHLIFVVTILLFATRELAGNPLTTDKKETFHDFPKLSDINFLTKSEASINSNAGILSAGRFFGNYWISGQTDYVASAAANCENAGMKLLSIETPSEDQDILLLMESEGISVAWTSGGDQFQDTQYLWTSTGSYFNYENWVFGTPSSPHFNCVFIGTNTFWNNNYGQNRGGWSVHDCSTSLHYICER